MAKNKTRKGVALLVAAIALVAMAPSAYALHSNEHYSLFGEASYVTPGNASDRAVRLVSDASPAYGGISYGVEEGLTFADIDQLSTDYKFESDDTCGGGSPRFVIGLTNATGASATSTVDEGNISVYVGPAPNYDTCASAVWLNSGDLLQGTMAVDSSQLDGGTFYDPYADALAKYGSYTVTSIKLVADAGWKAADGEQTVDIDNTMVDATLFDYEEDDVVEPPVMTTKEDCKKGGWMDLEDKNGNSFRNQGACVSYFAKNK